MEMILVSKDIKSENVRVFDESIDLKDNAMLKRRPELFCEWDFELNDGLGLDIYKVTFGSNKKALWKCSICREKYEMRIKSRVDYNKYCCPKEYKRAISLTVLNPELAKEWHPALNGELTPHDVTLSSAQKVWWLGSCGHEWSASPSGRIRKDFAISGCPYCSNVKVLKGLNDMWTTNPELAKLLLNPEDGYKYMQFSRRRTDWKCSHCENIIKNKEMREINIKGLFCSLCSDSLSMSEKVMRSLLKELKIEFVSQKRFRWLSDRLYDFYIPELSCIIEMHGGQHYRENGFKALGGRTLEEEQENDRLKKETAIENGIDNYIVIDARDSDFNYIKNNILVSEIPDLLDLNNVFWDRVFEKSSKSLNADILRLWNKGKTVKEIAETTSFHSNTVVNIIKKYESAGKCVYDGYRGYSDTRKHLRNTVYQFDLELNHIATWDGMAIIEKELNIFATSIASACRGKLKTAGGFIWKYEKDIDDSLREKINKKGLIKCSFDQMQVGSPHTLILPEKIPSTGEFNHILEWILEEMEALPS